MCGRTDEVGEGETRVRGTIVVVACGGMRRSAVVVLPVCGGRWWVRPVRTRRGQWGGHIVAHGGSDEVGEDDATSCWHGHVVVVVVARGWWSHPRLHFVIGDDDGEGKGKGALSSLLSWCGEAPSSLTNDLLVLVVGN